MYNYHNKKKLVWSVFLILLLVIGIGYAYLTSNLSIAGNTSVTTNTWNIHFENLSVTPGSVSASTAASINAAGDAITYTINLNRPKEYYEFTVDVKNDGTLPGKVSISTLSGLDTTSSKIIDYTIAYTNGNPVNIGDILNAGSKKNIKVRVFYKDEIDPTDFPASDLNLTLTYTLQYVQSEEDAFDTDALIEQLKTENSSCIYQYTGAVTDEVGVTKTNAENVYFNRCADKRNIKFNNICWQMIRTTETGGIKILYNGEPDSNGECGSSRADHKGIVGTNGSSQNLASSYLYGSSFTYDVSTNEFTLVDTSTATWSDSTYEDLIGKFTCKNLNGICTTIYSINTYSSNTTANTSAYSIADTNYSQIGKSSYNASWFPPSTEGYMFNKVYGNYIMGSSSINGIFKFGATFTYLNGIYSLSGTTQTISNWSSSYNTINDTHYTCWDTTGTCQTLSYVVYTGNNFAYYINMIDGKNVDDILNEMLWDDNVNKYNSSIKGIIDSWYAQNLSSKTNMLEDTVYCNAREAKSLGGWNPNGGSTTAAHLYFKNSTTFTKDMTCLNDTDQFSMSNNKAKLTYPISLLQNEERANLIVDSLMVTGVRWWLLSSYDYTNEHMRATVSAVNTDGSAYSEIVSNLLGVRPVVSLASGNVISEGDGSTTHPWVIDD